MEPWIVAVISIIAGSVPPLIGLVVARKKGLPAINVEIEQRMEQLRETLQGQLDATRTELEDCRTKLTDALRDRDRLGRELRETRRELRMTQDELLALYRSTGTKPPRHLEQSGE